MVIPCYFSSVLILFKSVFVPCKSQLRRRRKCTYTYLHICRKSTLLPSWMNKKLIFYHLQLSATMKQTPPGFDWIVFHIWISVCFCFWFVFYFLRKLLLAKSSGYSWFIISCIVCHKQCLPNKAGLHGSFSSHAKINKCWTLVFLFDLRSDYSWIILAQTKWNW